MSPEYHANMAALFAEIHVETVDELRSLHEALALRAGRTYTEEDHQKRKAAAVERANSLRAEANRISTGSYP